MSHSAIFALVVCLFATQEAFANCEPAVETGQNLSMDESSLRAATFREMCNRLNGDLVDSNNTELKSKLSFPKKMQAPDYQLSESFRSLFRHGMKYRVLVNMIVEPTGQISWVNVLTPSGEPRVDQAVVTLLRATKYRQPVTYDGKAVRAFHTLTFNFVP